MSIEEIALHEMLMNLAGHSSLLDEQYRNDRLVSLGLLKDDAEGVELTPAGIELCRSLQHKLAAEIEAARLAVSGDGTVAAGLIPAMHTVGTPRAKA